MAKTKKPAPKGGKKAAAPKKVAKKAANKKSVAPKVFKEIIKSARQMDQAVADKMRADAFAAANKQPQSLSQPVELKTWHPTVEEQFEAEVAAFEAAYRAKVMQPTTTAPPKKSMWARFRSAVTGLFVSKKFAEANPDTTVREKVD